MAIDYHNAALLTVASILAANTETPDQRRQCRDRLFVASESLESLPRLGPAANGILSTACASCGKCPGIGETLRDVFALNRLADSRNMA